MLTLSSTSMLIPVLARTSPYLVLAVRILQVTDSVSVKTTFCNLPS